MSTCVPVGVRARSHSDREEAVERAFSRGVNKVDYQGPKNAGTSQDQDEEESFDWEKISGYLRFVFGALKRHAFLALAVAIVGVSATYFVYWLMPRSYHVETQLLAQKTVIGAIAGRGLDNIPPTRAAQETVVRRDNLLMLIQKSEVAKNWDATRSNAARLKDWIKLKLGRKPNDDDKTDMILGTLESRLAVEIKSDWQGEGTVTISLDWPDPKMGYRLVNAAQQSFIEARHLTEVSAISEAMSILLGRAASLRDEIDASVKVIESKKATRRKRIVAERAERAAGRAERSPVLAVPKTDEPDVPISEKESTQQLRAMWEAKKSAIKDLEEMRRKRIGELQTKLAELRATYAENHPAIVDTNQTIETLSQESPQLAQLHREEASLHDQYLARSAKLGSAAEVLARPLTKGGSSLRAAAEPDEDDDRETEYAKAQLKFEATEYDRILDRIEGAHMELETARAALKYRYVIVKPAQLPRIPDKPKASKILGAGVAVSLGLALLAAVAADLRSGKVYERWQLERALRLPVVAEIRRDT
jgi:uncharacterized protein involved in exopolysaccharide biosynthesis